MSQSFTEYDNDGDNLTVLSILSTLQKLNELNENKSVIYYHGSTIDYTFSLTDKCTDLEISELEKNIGYSLPTDYKQFLSITNGLRFSGLAVSWLLDIKLMCELRSVVDNSFDNFKKNMLVIGQFFDGGVEAMIKLDSDEDKCMYVYDVHQDNCPQALNCGFKEFLHRFITTYGLNFWEWGTVKSVK